MFGHKRGEDCRGGHHRGERHGGPRGGGRVGRGAERGAGRGGWDMEGRGRGSGGGRHRMFDGGDLRLVLLKLIAEKPRHGYDLIRAIEERTGGAYGPSPGIVYPSLTMLTEMGFIAEQSTDGARKAFAITAEGTTHVEERAADVTAMLAKLDALGALRERTDAVPLRRAMHNLRSVLEHRLTTGFDKETLHNAVELIDEAARKIERL
jgi:DNA-binding PadR family transcriptional regulator